MVGEGSVLIIDDDAMSRRLVSSHLEKFFEVAWAPTAQAGRAKYFRNPSDIVIVEYRLPDCSGLDLVRELRDENEEVQIVMATRYGSEQVCASAFRLGVHDYLSKPVAEAELVATVRRLLHRVKSRKTSAVAAVPPVCADRRLQLVAEQIHDGYAKSLSVGALARKAGIGRSTLSRKFTGCFGMSIRAFIAQVRVRRAMDMLRRPGLSITEIAYDVGFYDLPRFDKVFRRIAGVSPSAYRRFGAEAQNDKPSVE